MISRCDGIVVKLENRGKKIEFSHFDKNIKFLKWRIRGIEIKNNAIIMVF
jgi:hypothetical protein